MQKAKEHKKSQEERRLNIQKTVLKNKNAGLNFTNPYFLRNKKMMTIDSNIKLKGGSPRHQRILRDEFLADKIKAKVKSHTLEKILDLNRKTRKHYERSLRQLNPHNRLLLDAKEKKKVVPERDSDLAFTKTSGQGVKGITGGVTYVEREKPTKPMYVNMSPIYDFRGY